MTDVQDKTTPPFLPTDREAFFRAGDDVDLLNAVPPPPAPHVLEQLGPPTFRKTTFPMMGFLASVYEHVAAQVAGNTTETTNTVTSTKAAGEAPT
jgi:hypothetical protein